MPLWKWEVWPWNWRQVRKAQISKEDRDLFERYGEAVIGSVLAGASCPTAPELNAIIPGNICLPENPGKCTAARDWLTECRDAHERREQRLETIEIGVVALITVEIALSIIFGVVGIYEAWKQGIVLDHLDRNTAATAQQIQKASDAMSSTLQVLQADRADRLAQQAKKPRLALYVGNVPIDQATVRLTGRPDYPQVNASFDLLVKNVGDAPLSTSRLHALLPEQIGLDVERLIIVPEFEAPARPHTQRVTLQLPLLPVGDTVRLHILVYVPKGHSAFKITFTLDASELQAVTPLGSLTILPLKP